LAAKADALRTLLQDVWDSEIPVTGSPVLWHYRNKVDPTFAPMQYPEPPPPGFERETVLGYKKRGRWFWPLDIAECHIGPQGMNELMAGVRDWYRSEGLKAYDNRTGEGFLCNLLIRDGKRTGDRMVVLITRPGDFDPAPFLKVVEQTFPSKSVYWGRREGTSDVAFAEDLTLLSGNPTIEEALQIETAGGCPEYRYRISPFSFFQTNTLATERLYGAIRAWVAEARPATLYDLYGGMGGIAFSCADLVQQVWSVEAWEAASVDGRFNAEVNGAENVTFITDKVKNYLKWRIQDGTFDRDASVVVDPPRAGMTPKAQRRLLELAPARIAYVSCNPKIFAREAPAFLERYRLTRVEAFDLFPHTRHVELLSFFERR
jgi:tRNA/tmRNA/rRNA uracil-C5-methylase (TrmA/RlmC/RlmD family)